jgi:hypothetical protein
MSKKMNMKECTAAEFAKFVYDPSSNFSLAGFDMLDGCVEFDDKLRILASACIDIRKKFPEYLASIASDLIRELTKNGMEHYLLKTDHQNMTYESAKETFFCDINMHGFQPIHIYNEVESMLKTKEGRDFMALSFCLPVNCAIKIKDDSTLRANFIGLSALKSKLRYTTVYMSTALECDFPILEAMYLSNDYTSARNAVDSICKTKNIQLGR